MTTIRFHGTPVFPGNLAAPKAGLPRFEGHHDEVDSELHRRALSVWGDTRKFPDQIRYKTTAEKLGLEEKEAQLLTQALNPRLSGKERKEVQKDLEKQLLSGWVDKSRVALVLVAARAIILEHRANGQEVSLPKPLLKKFLKTIGEFKHESGRYGLLWGRFPKSYDGPVFPAELEQEYLKILLRNNGDDNIHTHENNFTRSLAKSSPENRKLVLQEAHWLTPKLGMELLEEVVKAEPEESKPDSSHGPVRVISVSAWAFDSKLPNEEVQLATRQILKRLDECYPKEFNRSSLPQVGDVALDMILELREKQWMPQPLLNELFARSLNSPDYVLVDNSESRTWRIQDQGNNKKRAFEDYLKGKPFPDSSVEAMFIRGLIQKAHNFEFLAFLLDNAPPKGGRPPYDNITLIIRRIQELVDQPPREQFRSLTELLEHVDRFQSDRQRRALYAWNALAGVKTELPKDFSTWLMERAVPTSQYGRLDLRRPVIVEPSVTP